MHFLKTCAVLFIEIEKVSDDICYKYNYHSARLGGLVVTIVGEVRLPITDTFANISKHVLNSHLKYICLVYHSTHLIPKLQYQMQYATRK